MARERITLCFFVDALGWEAAQRHRAFQDLAPHAYRQRTILGYSCAAQPTILTGRMPSVSPLKPSPGGLTSPAMTLA